MSEEHPAEFSRPVTGPKYDYSAAAAAEILNLHFDASQPKTVRKRPVEYVWKAF